MSSLVMRPPRLEPESWRRSTLLSLAILRTSGEERMRPPSPAGAKVGTVACCCWTARCADGRAAALTSPPARRLVSTSVSPAGLGEAAGAPVRPLPPERAAAGALDGPSVAAELCAAAGLAGSGG